MSTFYTAVYFFEELIVEMTQTKIFFHLHLARKDSFIYQHLLKKTQCYCTQLTFSTLGSCQWTITYVETCWHTMSCFTLFKISINFRETFAPFSQYLYGGKMGKLWKKCCLLNANCIFCDLTSLLHCCILKSLDQHKTCNFL